MDNSHKTAISRTKPSRPTKLLFAAGLLRGRVLDYGCGKGFDVIYYDLEGYDPHYRPHLPEGKFDTIICNYVLNVVTEVEGEKIIEHIKSLLTSDGKAYITVRRDNFLAGVNGKGLYQRMVQLNYKSLINRGGFEMYELP